MAGLGLPPLLHDLLGLQLLDRRPLPRTTPDMDHTHDFSGFSHSATSLQGRERPTFTPAGFDASLHDNPGGDTMSSLSGLVVLALLAALVYTWYRCRSASAPGGMDPFSSV